MSEQIEADSAKPADSGRVGDKVVAALDRALEAVNAPCLTEKAERYASWEAVSVLQDHGRAIRAALAAQGQGEVACHRFVGPTGEAVTEWDDGLPDNGKRFPDLCPPVSSVQYAYFHSAPPASPAGVPDGEVRLWDTQWTNIVNHDNCYRDWDKADAINHAVKMTEQAIARNVTDGKLPPPRKAAAVIGSQS